LLFFWRKGVFDARERKVWRERPFINLEVAPFQFPVQRSVELLKGGTVQVS